ncbi:MAG: ribonuclease D [Clostridiales bacterium]|nr:ribonuclease D [Clostridiales bacterium]
MDNTINVTRIHIKPSGDDRNGLLQYCLDNAQKQFVVIGWSRIREACKDKIRNFDDLWNCVKETTRRINPALNVFWSAKKDDLFWTRDSRTGEYWICRALDVANVDYYNTTWDLGAQIPVEAYCVGFSIAGQLLRSFNKARGGIVQTNFSNDIVNYSKYIFNKCSGKQYYNLEPIQGDIIDNLPPEEMEELVITYLQVKKNYYVSSNSIAQKSTTPNIECILFSRDKANPLKAVVQVKSGHFSLDGENYKEYVEAGYKVYLYAEYCYNTNLANIIQITRQELTEFYNEYKTILPNSIVSWEKLID